MSLFGFDASSFNSSRQERGEDPSVDRADASSLSSSHVFESAFVSVSSADWTIDLASTLATLPPTWIEVQHEHGRSILEEQTTHLEDESSAEGGITILSSVPSSPQVEILTTSPLQDNNKNNNNECLSLEGFGLFSSGHSLPTMAAPVSTFSALGQRSLLSLNPSSLASSMTDMSMWSSSVSSVSSDNPPVNQSTPSAAFSQALVEHAVTHQTWFEQFQSEQDWDNFYKQALDLLAVVEDGNEELEHPDVLLSQLIAQEEAMFWKQQHDSNGSNRMARMVRRLLQQRGLLWLGETVLLAATAAALGGAGSHNAQRALVQTVN